GAVDRRPWRARPRALPAHAAGLARGDAPGVVVLLPRAHPGAVVAWARWGPPPPRGPAGGPRAPPGPPAPPPPPAAALEPPPPPAAARGGPPPPPPPPCPSPASAGALEPADPVARAAANGVEVLALTDHDTLDGVPDAARAAAGHGIELIPGVELSALVQTGSM